MKLHGTLWVFCIAALSCVGCRTPPVDEARDTALPEDLADVLKHGFANVSLGLSNASPQAELQKILLQLQIISSLAESNSLALNRVLRSLSERQGSILVTNRDIFVTNIIQSDSTGLMALLAATVSNLAATAQANAQALGNAVLRSQPGAPGAFRSFGERQFIAPTDIYVNVSPGVSQDAEAAVLKTLIQAVITNLPNWIWTNIPSTSHAVIIDSTLSNTLTALPRQGRQNERSADRLDLPSETFRFLAVAGLVGALCAWALETRKNRAFNIWLFRWTRLWCDCDSSEPLTEQQKETLSCERWCFIKRSGLILFYEGSSRWLIGMTAASIGPMLCGLINRDILSEANFDPIKFVTMFGVSVIAAFSGQKLILPLSRFLVQRVTALGESPRQSERRPKPSDDK